MSDAGPLIADPRFYAAALPAAFLVGLSKSGFASGFGALAVPLLALVVPVPQAAMITLPLLMAADVSGLQRLWRERDPALLRILMPAGLAGLLLGAFTFGLVSPKSVSALVGALTLLFLAQRLLFPPRADRPPAGPGMGRLLAVASGFTSFIAHAGGPPIAAWLLPRRLPPLRLAGTTAVFFAVINVSKIPPYAALGLIDLRNVLTSLVLIPVTLAGVAIGVWAVRRIDSGWFYRLAYLGMGVAGLKLLWDGLA